MERPQPEGIAVFVGVVEVVDVQNDVDLPSTALAHGRRLWKNVWVGKGGF